MALLTGIPGIGWRELEDYQIDRPLALRFHRFRFLPDRRAAAEHLRYLYDELAGQTTGASPRRDNKLPLPLAVWSALLFLAPDASPSLQGYDPPAYGASRNCHLGRFFEKWVWLQPPNQHRVSPRAA